MAEICDLARANRADGLPSAALEAFSSLGASGKHEGNQERDLHRWLHSLYGMKLTVYQVTMQLNVSQFAFIIYHNCICFGFHLCFSQTLIFRSLCWCCCGFSQTISYTYKDIRCFSLRPSKAANHDDAVPTQVPFLLPHEILDAVSRAGSVQWGRSMTGHRSSASIAAFWNHCKSLDEWKDHPALRDVTSLGRSMAKLREFWAFLFSIQLESKKSDLKCFALLVLWLVKE